MGIKQDNKASNRQDNKAVRVSEQETRAGRGNLAARRRQDMIERV